MARKSNHAHASTRRHFAEKPIFKFAFASCAQYSLRFVVVHQLNKDMLCHLTTQNLRFSIHQD